MKIAIALEAEGSALAHFGHAGKFHVYDDREGTFQLVECRPNSPPCGSESSDELMAAAVQVISDCAAVLAARFGPCALRETAVAGVYPFETGRIHDDRLPATLARLRDLVLPRYSQHEGRNVP